MCNALQEIVHAHELNQCRHLPPMQTYQLEEGQKTAPHYYSSLPSCSGCFSGFDAKKSKVGVRRKMFLVDPIGARSNSRLR